MKYKECQKCEDFSKKTGVFMVITNPNMGINIPSCMTYMFETLVIKCCKECGTRIVYEIKNEEN